jgi:hypothetical protein
MTRRLSLKSELRRAKEAMASADLHVSAITINNVRFDLAPNSAPRIDGASVEIVPYDPPKGRRRAVAP